jgi:hypothetical protein
MVPCASTAAIQAPEEGKGETLPFVPQIIRPTQISVAASSSSLDFLPAATFAHHAPSAIKQYDYRLPREDQK